MASENGLDVGVVPHQVDVAHISLAPVVRLQELADHHPFENGAAGFADLWNHGNGDHGGIQVANVLSPIAIFSNSGVPFLLWQTGSRFSLLAVLCNVVFEYLDRLQCANRVV